jgi:hypothetical protein
MGQRDMRCICETSQGLNFDALQRLQLRQFLAN